MPIVLIGWLYVIGMMSLTASSVVNGAIFFIGAGLVPTLSIVWLFGRSRRARGRGRGSATPTRTSALEQDVHAGDDAKS